MLDMPIFDSPESNAGGNNVGSTTPESMLLVGTTGGMGGVCKRFERMLERRCSPSGIEALAGMGGSRERPNGADIEGNAPGLTAVGSPGNMEEPRPLNTLLTAFNGGAPTLSREIRGGTGDAKFTDVGTAKTGIEGVGNIADTRPSSTLSMPLVGRIPALRLNESSGGTGDAATDPSTGMLGTDTVGTATAGVMLYKDNSWSGANDIPRS